MLTIEWTANGVTQLLDFDAGLSENFESPAEVTDHTVETGAAITDFVRPGNDTFTCEAWATNTPIAVQWYRPYNGDSFTTGNFGLDGATLATGSTSLELGGGNTLAASVYQASQPYDRVTAVDNQLLAFRDGAQLLTVHTSLRSVTNCVIASYKVTRSGPNDGNILNVSIDFRRIRIATTQRVTVQAPAQRRGQATQNRGSQPAQTPTQAEANASFGARILGIH